MMEIVFLNKETGKVNYAITDVALVRYITPSEIGFTYMSSRNSSCAFPNSEKLEVRHI